MISNELNQYLTEVFDNRFELDESSLTSGANNQGVKVESQGKHFFLKQYNRLNRTSIRQRAESEFSQYLLTTPVSNYPRLVHSNTILHASIFEYINGERVNTVGEYEVEQAIEFLLKSQNENTYRMLSQASDGALTSEAFISCVESRLKRFELHCQKQGEGKTLETNLVALIREKIEPSITQIRHRLRQSDELPKSLLASASDFGFHNALCTHQGLYFFDFEYAGLDSFYKWLFDFIGQPEHPVSPDFIQYLPSVYKTKLNKVHPKTLLNCYQATLLKWTLIILNPILKSSLNNQKRHESSIKIEKARQYFDVIEDKVYRLEHNLIKIN